MVIEPGEVPLLLTSTAHFDKLRMHYDLEWVVGDPPFYPPLSLLPGEKARLRVESLTVENR
jgi:hypothetical protein